MKQRPLITISLILISLVITLMAPIFDNSIYGFNHHPTEWLSFSPNAPLRHWGLSLIFSPFLHMNFVHVLTNMIFFIPVGMMIERKESGRFLAVSFVLLHALVLLLLVMVNLFFSLEGKAFLGTSHVVIGLYTFWSLKTKNFALLFWPLFIIGWGLWEPQPMILLAHTLGLFAGIKLFFWSRLWDKFRSQRSH